MIELNYNGTTLKVHNDDSSYCYMALKSKPQLVLKFSLHEFIEFPVGTYCDFMGMRFTLKSYDDLKKNGERDIEYTMTLGTDVDDLADYKMRNSVDHRLKWSMCAKPVEFIKEIVDELNQKGTGVEWSVGDCIDSTEKTVEFNHTYIYDALNSIAEKFDTEWEINGNTISLKKVEYFKEDPLPLSYGKGNGFQPNVGRTVESSSKPIKRLFVQGGSDNIDRYKYGSAELLLPKGQSYTYEGHTYTSDKDGYYIERTDKAVNATREDSIDLSEIYPSRVGTVSKVETINKDKNLYNIIDVSIPDALNFNDCLIEGETPTIIFQSGMLAGDGKEFEFKYKHTITKDGEKVAERRFEIVPQEIDGVTMPNETFKPAIGDKYAIFGIMLPQAYICNDTDKSGASWDMFKEAAKYLYEHEEQKFTFTGTLQGLWAKKHWDNIGGRFKIGSYIRFKDKQFLANGVDVRIIGIKQYINSPYSPTIEISNSTVGESIASDLNKIDNTQVTINDTKNDILSFTKRRFRDAEETAKMLQDALLNYSSSIDPITVHTMQLLVGDESLQFDYIASTSQPENVVACNFKWNEKEKTINCDKTAIIHYTVGINDLSSSHTSKERKKWDVMGLASGALTDASKKYYIYIKCPYSSFNSDNVSTETAEFILSETAKSMDDTDNSCYYFLAGILNSEYDGTRSFVAMNGFTEITPGQILADRLISKSGTSYFDMLNNAIKLGDKLDFNSKGDGKLVLKGTLIQRGDEEQPIIMYRGMWDVNNNYYVNDVVYYYVGSVLSSYICIMDAVAGIAPTDTVYWRPFAEGTNGKTGNTIVSIYRLIDKGQQPATPTFSDVAQIVAQSTWKRYPIATTETTYLYMSQATLDPNTGAFITAWSTPIRISGEKGESGADGTDIEFIYLNNTGDTPSTPTSQNTDDYIPSGWTDNPTGVSESKQYEWVSVRTKEKGASSWGAFSTPAIWAKWGEQGIDGDGVEYIFVRTTTKQTLSAPTSVDVEDYVPDGWTDEPSGVSVQYPYEYVSIRHKTNGHWGSFSTPQLWSYYAIVKYTEIRFAKNGSTTTPPTLDKTSANPTGWTTSQPTVGTLEYLWMTVAQKQTDGTLVSNWSDPVRVTPKDGKDGEAGKSPALVFRGVYDSTKLYYGNQYRVDAVKYNSVYYVARIDAGEFKGIVPTDTSKWNGFGAQFESIATNLLLAENANIAGWVFRDNKLYSQNGSTYLDGVNGDVDIKGKFIGQIKATSGSFQGTNGMYEILLDADNRTFTIKGPRKVTTFNGFTPKSGTTQVEYLKIGNFVNVGGSDSAGYDIVPQIELDRLTEVGNVKVTLDPYNGLLFQNTINGVTYSSIFAENTIMFGNLDSFPSSRNFAAKGEIYRDGETLKIRTT